MHIQRIEIDRFGPLRDVVINPIGTGVEVFHGTNEIGKTSVLEFVRGVLFGFDRLFANGRLDPRGSASGRLVVAEDGRRWTLEREHDTVRSRESLSGRDAPDASSGVWDVLRIVDAEGLPQPASLVREWTAGIDAATYASVMAFGLDELHELSTLDADGCGRRLYELAGGLDRSRVARVLGDIAEAIDRLDSSSPDISPIASLRQQLAAAESRLASLRGPAIPAGDAWAESARLEAEIPPLAKALARAEAHAQRVLAAVELEPAFLRARETSDAVAAFGHEPLVHPDHDEWQLLVRRRDRAEKRAAALGRIRSRASGRYRSSTTPSPAWRKRTAIASLADDQPRLERLLFEAAQSEASARVTAHRFGEMLGTAGVTRLFGLDAASLGAPRGPDARLGPPAAWDPAYDPTVASLRLPPGFSRPFGALRTRAREIAEALREVKEAKRAVVAARGGIDGLRREASSEPMRLADAIEQASEQASRLRNRITAGEQLAEASEAVERLERQVAAGLRQQLVPVEWLLGLGAVFVLGAGLLLSGLLLPSAVTGGLAYALAALGLAGVGIAGATTWSLDRAASGRVDSVRRQLETARRQRQEALQACEQLDRLLPAEAARSLARLASEADAEVHRLEELAAREGTLSIWNDRLTAANERYARARAAEKTAKAAWRRALDFRGLPATLRPREVRELSLHRKSLLVLDDERRRAAAEAGLRRDSVNASCRRIEELLAECDMLPEDPASIALAPIDQIRRLRERVEADAASARSRSRYRRALLRARKEHRAALAAVTSVRRKLGALYARWEVDDEHAFLTKVDRREEFQRLRDAARAAADAWERARAASVGDSQAATDLLAELDRWLAEAHAPGEPFSLDRRLHEADVAVTTAREALQKLRERRAAAVARAEAAATDRSGEPLQAEIADIRRRLEMQAARRANLAAASDLLVETRLRIARDHQPPVLREASSWLSRLTEGRYTSVTTLLDEADLRVHDGGGREWKPDHLSRGTREQVFLALRLALVSDLERRGVSVPVIMDDALVNFDDPRAEAAARVLVEFASGGGSGPRQRQLLVLTCHSHVADVFARAGARVRSLDGSRAVWNPPRLAAIEPAPPREPEPVMLGPPVAGPGDGIPELPSGWRERASEPREPIAPPPVREKRARPHRPGRITISMARPRQFVG